MRYAAKCVVAIAALLPLAASTAGGDDLAQLKSKLGDFRDITFVAEVVQKDKKVLDRMDKRLSLSYEFSKAQVWFKMPYNTRIDGTLGVVKARLITTDKLSILRIPSLRYTKKEDISGEPAKRQSALDVGILTPQMFSDYEVKLLPEDQRRPGLIVLDLLRPEKGASIRRLWIDPAKLRLVRMEKRRPDGRLVGAYVYLDYERFLDKISVPRRVELYSKDDKLAAAVKLRDIQVDTNLADSLFE